jgi:hypothetical protein
MATKRTGRPRGAPKKRFLSDPDRHLLAFIAAEIAINCLTFEHAALLSRCLDSERIKLPPNPKRHARRLELSQFTKRKLEEGWLLQSYKRIRPPQETGSRIDTLRKKARRLENDEAAQRWLYYMRNAYIALLQDGPDAEQLILAFAKEAGERPYFENLLAFLRAADERTVDHACADVK